MKHVLATNGSKCLLVDSCICLCVTHIYKKMAVFRISLLTRSSGFKNWISSFFNSFSMMRATFSISCFSAVLCATSSLRSILVLCNYSEQICIYITKINKSTISFRLATRNVLPIIINICCLMSLALICYRTKFNKYIANQHINCKLTKKTNKYTLLCGDANVCSA